MDNERLLSVREAAGVLVEDARVKADEIFLDVSGKLLDRVMNERSLAEIEEKAQNGSRKTRKVFYTTKTALGNILLNITNR